MPVANAGPDKTITAPASSVTLDGSGTDADGTIVRYRWSDYENPNRATFSSDTVANPTVSGLIPGHYVFFLTVTDNEGNESEADAVFVTVNPPPTTDQHVSSFTLVNADTDQDIMTLTDGATLNYYSLPTQRLNIRANTAPGPVGSVGFNLTGGQTRNYIESTAPYALYGDAGGNYNPWSLGPGSYTLKATSYTGAHSSGTAGGSLTVRFTIINQGGPNQAPVANAGLDFSTYTDKSPALSGSGRDAEGPIASWQWRQVSGPNNATFSSTTVAVPTISGLAQGTYVFSLVVTDTAGLRSTPDEVNVTVYAAQSTAPSVSTFTLVNADTEQDIMTLSHGATLDLATLPTRNLNIRANTAPATVGSVRFVLGGAQSHFPTESGAPYTLFGDAQGNYNAWTPATGAYELKATPYTGSGGAGTAGTALTVHFNVVDGSATHIVTSFTLVNADTEQDIRTLQTGDTLNLATLPTRNLNIRANAGSAAVRSVVFNLLGTQTRYYTESTAPFTLFGDVGGNYHAWTPVPGPYHLKATPYSSTGGSGTAGSAYTVNFIVVDESSNQAPVADAGSDRSLQQPNNSTTLAGRGTDADGTIAAYNWTLVSGPNTPTFNSSMAQPTVSGMVNGTYVFALVVTDDKGAQSQPDEVTVTLSGTATATQSISSFTLVNADTDQDIMTLTDGATLNLAALPTRNLNIRANTAPSVVGSVILRLSGRMVRTVTESGAPYALFAETGGNYSAWTPLTGPYYLSATPYTNSGGAGTAGASLNISFNVVDQPASTTSTGRQAGAATAVTERGKGPGRSTAAGAADDFRLKVFPNPSATGRVTIQMAGAWKETVTYSLYTANGVRILSGRAALPSGTALLPVDLGVHGLTGGAYQLVVEDGTHRKTVRVLLSGK
ncbi:PKD domain-containing protein [Flaviaesturariibacter amylovorans]|uniref:PKD/Chitinase domain-containing protein n=1 Tax=Flaviaesturariibacter amylovorans TaxID=1084520 RepID=A0ABP8GGB4_9BACT